MVQWWDAARIDATVTRQFVCKHLLPEEIERLDRSLAFGDGLTDGTYWEWIDTKAKRLFLVLLDLGIPDQIFGIIDDSWDDHDLPISKDQIDRLALTAVRDDRIDRKFFLRQFHYILKPLQKGDHTDFTDNEIIPVESLGRGAGLASGSHGVDKVTLPNYPGHVFCRRRLPFGTGRGCLTPEEFAEAIGSIKGIQNQHLVSYHASYTHNNAGCVLFTPFADLTLKSFFSNATSSFKALAKQDRRRLVMNWMLCLVDTLAYIHSRRLSHGNIKPSAILLTNQLHIFYSDFSRMNADILSGLGHAHGHGGVLADKSSFDRESYDYAAPEQWFRPTTGPSSPGSRKAAISMSTSPETHTIFSIPRHDNPSSPNAMLHSPNPHLNPQAADIFSLGCVLLEMMGFILKKSTKSFATHRAAKNKTAGRGGAVPDSSFHKNLGQVESWMTALAKEASKKTSDADGAHVFRGAVPMLHVISRMLSANPNDRPSADEIQQRIYQVLTQYCGIMEPHCVHRYSGWDFGMGNLRVQSPGPQGNFASYAPARSNYPMGPGWEGGSTAQGGLTHSRTNSIGGVSSNSGASSSASSGRAQDVDAASIALSGTAVASLRGIRMPNVRSPEPSPWQPPPTGAAVYAGHGEASVY